MKTYADRHDDGRRKRRRNSSLNRFRDELAELDDDQLQLMVDAPNDYVNDIFNQFEMGQESAGESAHLITEDELSEAEGLMGKSEFLEIAEAAVRSKLQESFEGTGFTEKDCPWLKHLFRHYGRRSAKYLEHSFHKYLPGTKQAESIEEYIAPLGEKVQRAIAAWLKTGQITEVPAEIPRSLMRVAGQDAANQRARMGKGKELDSSTKSKMEGAFGTSIGEVKVHTESEGSSFATELEAQAATIGNDIAFASNKYKPGTPEGDALIAHELAHVLQQQGSATTGEMGSGADYSAMEEDAEGATRGVLGRLWGGMKGSFADLKANAWPRLKSGLQVQRCKQDTEDSDLQAGQYEIVVADIPNNVTIKSSTGAESFNGRPTYSAIDTELVNLADLAAGTYTITVTQEDGTVDTSSVVHSGGAATFFIKTELSDLTSADQGDQTLFPPDQYPPAKDFNELITLVRRAEIRLKAEGQDVATRIKTLRGIYYGTTWSFDYVMAEGSGMRNTGFTFFLYGLDAMLTLDNLTEMKMGDKRNIAPKEEYVPFNPLEVLGKNLFGRLFNSYEVKDQTNRQVDFGHIMIGLEARLTKPNNQEQVQLVDPRVLGELELTDIFDQDKIKQKIASAPPMGGTGVELTTWVGDLGGGTSVLAQKRISDDTLNATTVFEDEHSYGAPINLEGDIASFVIGAPDNAVNPYGLAIDEEKGIAGVLEEYLTPRSANDKYSNRAMTFLSFYGAVFDADSNVTNKADIVLKFTDKLNNFAFFYKESRLKDEVTKNIPAGQSTAVQEALIDQQMKKIAANIPQAASDVAVIFVDILEKVAKDPAQELKP